MNSEKQAAESAPVQAHKSKRGPLFQVWRGFWLVFLVVSLGYAWHCFYVPSNDVAWAADYEEARQRAVKTDQPMILFFTSTWCVPCRVMKRTVWADEAVARIVNKQFVPVSLYVTDPEVAPLLARYQVGATPLTIITDADGKVYRYILGKVEKAEFLEWLAQPNELAIAPDAP